MPPLRTYLIGVVALGMVPLIILAAWLIHRLDGQHREATRENAILTARALSDAVDRALNDSVASLEALASSPLLDQLDLRGFEDRLVAVGRTRGWTDAALLDASGRPLLRTAQSVGEALQPVADREVFEAVRGTGRPAVVSAVAGRSAGPPAITVGVPVSRWGVIHYVLVAGVPPAQLRRVLLAQSLPADWQIGLSDHRQRIVASTLDPGPPVGESIRSRLASESAQADEGWFPNIDRQGHPNYVVFHRSPRSGLVLTVGRPRSAVDGPANRALGLAGALGLVVIGLGFVAALGLARRLQNSLARVRHSAEALGRGQAPAGSGAVAVREHRAILDALERSAALLAAHAKEIEARETALRQSKAEAESARDELAHRVTGLTLLAELSTRLVAKGDLRGSLLEMLDAAIRVTGGDMGNIQMRDPLTGGLEIAVQRGFEAEFLTFFRSVQSHEAACGTAMGTRQRVLVEDVATHPIFANTEARGVLLRAGVRAVQSTPLWSGTGELVGMVSTHYRDVHHWSERELQMLDVLGRLAGDYIHRTRTEREIEETRVRLEAADRAKDEFLAMLGHELRNPLGAIASASSLLSIAGGAEQMAEPARAVIARQVQLLSRLVDDLLDVSRVTSGKIVLLRQPVDLAQVVTNAVNGWRSSGRLDRYQVVVDVSSAWIDADEARIEQVLSNLVGNALKYTPVGGAVAVRVRADGETAILQVQDTGAGIPSDLIDRVFDLFVQGERTIDRAQGGLGIGLTLVKALVEMHGGTIEATSEGPGKGSTFTVRLPRIRVPGAPRATTLPPPPVTGRRRILIIEDHDDAREMLRVQLTLVGHEVHAAGDGPAGVALAAMVAPDVALIDVGLPGLDGYEVARQIRAGAGGQSIRLIALTGYGQPDDRRRAVEAGFDAHATKPVLPSRLVELIAAARLSSE